MGAVPTAEEELCRQCGGPLTTAPTGRPGKYCSAACRQRAYRTRVAGAPIQNHNTFDPPSPRSGRPSPAPGVAREREVPHLAEAELLAWRGMLEVERQMLPLMDEELQRRTGLTISEFDVLYQLWIAPSKRRRMKHLAQAVLVTPGGITRMVGRLEERKLVRRVNSAGRQAVEAELTPAGEEQLHIAMDVHFHDVRRLFIDKLSATDVAWLVELWQRLRRGLPQAAEEG